MTIHLRRLGRPVAGSAAVAALILGLAVLALQLSSPAKADSSSCSDPVTTAPTDAATVSAVSGPFGQVLVIGSGAYSGCSLYLLTSDQVQFAHRFSLRV